MSTDTNPVLAARLHGEQDARRPARLVIVNDPEVGDVRVRWRVRSSLSPARRYHCANCGPQVRAECAHTFSAALALAEDLLGIKAAPEPAHRKDPA